jgi:chemotaxis protein CheD
MQGSLPREVQAFARDQRVVTLHPGDYYATREDAVVSTVLGSCVSVGLYDAQSMAGGLNHFMLPGELGKDGLAGSASAKYGMYAMEILINDLMKLGIAKSCLRAKVFGGGAVLRGLGRTAMNRIPAGNVEFAFEYLKKEGIPVIASDVGGDRARRIFFFARGGKVLQRKFGGPRTGALESEEERYFEELRSRDLSGPIELFDRGC